MKDLGTVKGDYASVALGANEKGEVVGLSIDKTGVPRAFLRRNGVMIDLNILAGERTHPRFGCGGHQHERRDCRVRGDQQRRNTRLPGNAMSLGTLCGLG